MSRIGLKPIELPEGVDVTQNGSIVVVKGKLGELSQEIKGGITMEKNENIITFSRSSNQPEHRSLHGLYRSLVNNMVVGVSKGFRKELELVGVGYRASHNGQKIDISVGYSHNIVIEVPLAIKVETEMEKGKTPKIKLFSYDKQLLGAVASKIRSFRKPEPYKGKGIKYVDEYIRRKEGKTAAKA